MKRNNPTYQGMSENDFSSIEFEAYQPKAF